MNEQSNPEPFLKLPAIKVEQPLGEFYAVAIPAKKLLQICYTDRLRVVVTDDSYTLEGSQRLISDDKLNKIGMFIDTREAAFPNSIILAANYNVDDGFLVTDEKKRWFIQPKDGDGCLELVIPTSALLAPVIDGQHRLFGFTHASNKKRLEMPVLCSVFIDLPKPYQAYLFATINSTQKPVSKSQTYELFGYNIDEEPAEMWSPEKLAVFLVRKFNTDIDGPLFSRILVAAENDFAISRAEAKAQDRWMVSTATVVDGITRLISTSPKKDALLLRTGKGSTREKLRRERSNDNAPLRELYLETRDKVVLAAVSNFFAAVIEVFGVNLNSSSYLTKTVGVQALFDTLRVLAPEALEVKDFSKEWFLHRLAELKDIDFAYQAFQQASGQGRTQIKKVIFYKLHLEQKLSGDDEAAIQTIIDEAVCTPMDIIQPETGAPEL